MSKIVFFCISAHGHTNPTLEVVRELISQGHEVLYYSYNSLREKIEATGARFISCDEYDCEQKLSPKDATRVGKDIGFSTEILVNTTLALDDMVCKEMEKLQPDCIVADSMAIWGKAIALKLGIPFISSTTTFAFNQESSKIMKQSIGQLFNLIISMPKINRNLKKLQAKNYPFNNILDIIQNDNNTDTIVYTSTMFQPCADTFSDKYSFVGPSIRPAESTFVKEREKLIYISMGTVVNDLLKFYKNCINALKDTEYQVVISIGNLVKPEELGTIPENISIHNFVDQIAVLQQADVFLSHCGMNSASESIYHGVPLVMYPQTAEQGAVATRISQLNAGVLLAKNNPETILSAIREVLDSSVYRENALSISDSFKQSGGAKAAAAKIIDICNRNKV